MAFKLNKLFCCCLLFAFLQQSIAVFINKCEKREELWKFIQQRGKNKTNMNNRKNNWKLWKPLQHHENNETSWNNCTNIRFGMGWGGVNRKGINKVAIYKRSDVCLSSWHTFCFCLTHFLKIRTPWGAAGDKRTHMWTWTSVGRSEIFGEKYKEKKWNRLRSEIEDVWWRPEAKRKILRPILKMTTPLGNLEAQRIAHHAWGRIMRHPGTWALCTPRMGYACRKPLDN
jgi:hypothetical protein